MSCPSFTVCLGADPLPLFLQQVETGSVFWLRVSLMSFTWGHLRISLFRWVFLLMYESQNQGPDPTAMFSLDFLAIVFSLALTISAKAARAA